MIQRVYKKWRFELVGTYEWRAVQWVVHWFLKLTTGSCVCDEIHSIHSKQHLDRFSSFCTADVKFSLYVTYTAPPNFSPNLLLAVERAWPPYNIWELGPTRPTTSNGISIVLAVFPQCTLFTNGQTDSRLLLYTLYYYAELLETRYHGNGRHNRFRIVIRLYFSLSYVCSRQSGRRAYVNYWK